VTPLPGDPGLWAPLIDSPGSTGIFADFDGTLAPIVDDPAEARPVEGMVEVLRELTGTFAVVAVLTGRPVEFLEGVLPSSVLIVGLYGLEMSEGGKRNDHPQGGSWRQVTDDVTALAEATGPEGMRVESKGLSVTFHYRGRPEISEDVRECAERQAERSGMVCRPAKMSYELHPPIPADKGTALVGLSGGLEAVLALGDDVGDLPAFEALDALSGSGVHVVRVAVAGPEAPADLVARADVVVERPEDVVAIFEELARARLKDEPSSSADVGE
jgi:trehalose 6-phosphate phosphatase